MNTPVFSLFGWVAVMATFVLGGDIPAFSESPTAPGISEIKAYDIDFNWGPGGPNGFAKPGLWADADPAAHVAWYKSIGCNVIQSFCVSCNGYAWYKNGLVPEQPGLLHDFLPEMVRQAHREKMLVFGYFCAGSNTRWGKEQPTLSYGFPSEPHIPYTDRYLSYLDAAIRDAVSKTGIDGFMVDWLRMPTTRASNNNRWLECEKELYAQLMAEPFPGEKVITPAQLTAYGRKAVDRAWQTIRKAARETNPNCLVWLTCCDVNDPHIADSRALKETDWLLNEAGDLKRTADAKRMIGPQTRLVTCLAAWNQQDPATIVPEAKKNHTGLYGFTKPTAGNLKPAASFYLESPVTSFNGDDRNIASLARAYLGVPQDFIQPAPPSPESRTNALKPAGVPTGEMAITVNGKAPVHMQDQKLGLTTGNTGAWQFYPAAKRDPVLPCVLLIGDSICNGYRGVVTRELAGKAAVDVWMTPAAENDPGLYGDLEKVLKQGPYAVVHFNIGLHGWPKGRIPDGQYEPLMKNYVEVLRKHAPNAKLIWASSTPITVKDHPAELDPTDNPTITDRNASAARIMQEAGVAVIDLYSLVVEKRAGLARGDRFHWKAPAYELMGKQIADRIIQTLPVAGVASPAADARKVGDGSVNDTEFPSGMECLPQPIYRHRADGKAGREITITLGGAKLHGEASVRVDCDGKAETASFPAQPKGTSVLTILLPEGCGVAKDSRVTITLSAGAKTLIQTITVPAKRQWRVYLYPHSHVDVGYTNPQAVVEKIHIRNMDVGMELGSATADYPAGARHVWNNEVGWAVESWLRQATPEQKNAFVAAVKKGQIGLSASYLNLNTSVASDEELMRFFAFARELRRMTGTPIDTMCQFDIPGLSWGIVQAAAQNGVRAILDFPNPSDRTGNIHTWRNRPFYWIAPDGKSKVLYLQCFPYNVAWKLGAFNLYPKPYVDVPGRDRVHFANTPLNGSGEFKFNDFIFNETAKLEQAGSPYDIYPCAWSLSDNAPVDVDLPDYVKKWNESYAYPRLIIASASTIANAYESRFGSIIPERKGDLTEYWTDGLGSDARRVGFNRPAKEDLVQAEILSTMLHDSRAGSAGDRYAAWRWIQLGTEHTWGYMMPDQPIAKSIEATKASYFENARTSSLALLNQATESLVKSDGNTVAVFNTLSWHRTDLAALQVKETGVTLTDQAGKIIPVQRCVSGGTVFLADDVPALGVKNYHLDRSGPPERAYESDLKVTTTTLENALVKVSLNPTNGEIASLVDKRTGHDFVNAKSRYALNSYRYLRGGDAPDKASVPAVVKIAIKENGPVLASLVVESTAAGCRQLTSEIGIIAGQPQVVICNTVDKAATRAKEGIHFAFAFNLPGDATPRMDIPWGVMNPLTDQLAGANKNWLACQRWIDVSAADCGVTWVPREASVVQFGDITANLLGSVAQGAWKTEIGDTRTIVSWALNNHWHTNFPLEQGGVIPFRYAILPHGAYDPVAANRFGLACNQLLVALPVASPITIKPVVTLDNPRVFVSGLMPVDDGKSTMLRLRSLSDQAETVHLAWPAGTPQSIRFSDATESPGAPVSGAVTLLPYGVITLRLQLQ